MDLNLEQLEDFAVLAAERHFGRAAVRRHLSPSALSKRVQRLERRLGVRLVERDGGGFAELTPAGERLLPGAQLMLRDADRARRAVLRAAEPCVRLGVPGAPGDHLSAGAWRTLVAGVDRMLPGCRAGAVGVPYGRLTQSVRSGRVDVLLTTGGPESTGLAEVPLAAVGRVCLLPRRHRLAEAAAVTMAQIADLPMVTEPTTTPEWMAPWVLGDVRGPREMRLVEVRARGLADVGAAVVAGTAVTLALGTVVPVLGPAVAAPVVSDAPPVEIVALHRRGDDRDEVLALLDMLRILGAALGPGRR